MSFPFLSPTAIVAAPPFSVEAAYFVDEGSAPTSEAVYFGFVAALAHADTSEAGKLWGKSVISDFEWVCTLFALSAI